MKSTLPAACGFAALFVLTLAASTSAQEKKPADPAKPAEKVTFQDHIVSIFRTKCGKCHSAGEAKGGLVLDNYAAAMAGGASGTVVEPGNLEDSRLWLLVSHKEQPAMPPKEAKLPDEALALIGKWIAGGALENKDSVVKVKAKPMFSLSKTDATGDKPAGPPPMPENLPTEPRTLSARGNVVTAVSASPWAPVVALAGHKQVLLYDLNDFTLAGVLPFPEGTINVLKFSRNGTLLLAAGGRGGQSGRAVVFDVKTGKRVFEGGSEFDAVLAADISPNHSLIALGGPKKLVRVYSTQDGELQYELKKHTDWITALEFSPDGVLLATGDRSNGLIVWEAETGREFYVLNGHGGTITGISWRVDSNVVASCSEDGTVRLWEMNNGTQIKNWGGHGGGAGSVQFLRDGRLVSTGRDRVTKLWDQNGTQVRAFPALADLGLRVTYAETNGFVLAGDWTGTLKVWNAADGADRATLVTNPPALAVRIEAATKDAAAATQSAAELAALQKMIAERKAAADAAVKAATDAQFAANAATVAKTQADQVLAVKLEAFKAAEAAVPVANAALEKAKVEKEAAEKAEDKKDVPAKTAAFQAAEQAVAAAKKTVETATAEKAAAEKSVADAAAKVKATADQAVALKAAADKAVAAANPTADEQKALAAADAAVRQTAEAAAARKALVARLTAEKARSVPTAVATPAK